MKIIFVRHGEINIKDGKLTRLGIRQMKDVSRYLKSENIGAIFCSPQMRSIQSANILNKKINVPLYIIKEFDERQMPDLKNQKLLKEYRDNYLDYSYRTKAFETCKEFIDRVIKGIKLSIKKEDVDTTILIVAHSSTLYAINAFISGIPEDKHIRWMQCSNGTVIKFFVNKKTIDKQ